jgi:hypothetical protein
MRTVALVALLLCISATFAAAQPAWDGRYFWVIMGHDVAGTGTAQAGVTPYLSAEDWVVGTPAYSGNGGPDALRRLPNGTVAPMGRTPTERTGKIRVCLAGVEALGAKAAFSRTSRLAKLDHGGKVMILLPGSRIAMLDGKAIALSDTPAMRDGQLYVPVTDVAEKLMGMKPADAVGRISRAVAK